MAEDPDWQRIYGRFEPLTPRELRTLMAGFERPWWIVGGYAIEAFTGIEREHEDIDMCIFVEDVPAFRAHLEPRYHLWSNDGGTFRFFDDRHPEPLAPLMELAHNLGWSWHPEAVRLFKRLDRDLWEETGHNPVKMLGLVDQGVLERVAQDQSYLHGLSLVNAAFRHHNERRSWCQRQFGAVCEPSGGARPLRIAYFSAEFGLTECFQIYSGGLGCLAGDHLKSASELVTTTGVRK